MDRVIGVIEFALYIGGILMLSMAVTWLVVKLSPSESAKEQQAQDEAKA
jgi:hypothetical protein